MSASPATSGTIAKGQIDLDADPRQCKLRAEGRIYHFKWDNESCGGSAQAWKQGLLSVMKRASHRIG